MSLRGEWRDPEDMSDGEVDAMDVSLPPPPLKPLRPFVPAPIDVDSDSDIEIVEERPALPSLRHAKNLARKTSSVLHTATREDVEMCLKSIERLGERLSGVATDEQYTGDDLVFEMANLELDRQYGDVFATSEPTNFSKTHSDLRYYSTSTEGDMVYQKLISCLDAMPLKLSYLQKLFITLSLNVLAPIIYGDEWRNRTAEVMKRRGWADLNPLMAAVCARRFGKTIAVSILSAMLMLCVPGVQIAVFAPSHKQAVALLKSAVDILKSHPWWGNYRVHSDTQQKVEIIGPDGTLRSIAAYASKHKVRGGEKGWVEGRMDQSQNRRFLFARGRKAVRLGGVLVGSLATLPDLGIHLDGSGQ